MPKILIVDDEEKIRALIKKYEQLRSHIVMLPAIISVIILLVGNKVARAFSLAGAFSLIRFRSAAGNPRDIAHVFFTLAVGLACGMGFIAYARIGCHHPLFGHHCPHRNPVRRAEGHSHAAENHPAGRPGLSRSV